ncbi:hypothetical protein [Almyronema epifaneia]|uniref:Lipoprotein n=1 Tax=Almyronema epifaneia S1 TaxID=2991925 RepID=A0ABW6IJ62_9CYAN
MRLQTDLKGLQRLGAMSAIALALTSCQAPPLSSEANSTAIAPSTPASTAASFAEVIAVEATAGEPGAYTLAVTIKSPDTGCDQYANWWEVISEEGDLIFRRVLAHSHVEEQPFWRPGGAIAVQPEQTLIIRAHMYPTGYGRQAMQGSVSQGFTVVQLAEGFAAELAQAAPQPPGCDH